MPSKSSQGNEGEIQVNRPLQCSVLRIMMGEARVLKKHRECGLQPRLKGRGEGLRRLSPKEVYLSLALKDK